MSEKTIAILGDRWRPQAAKQERDETSKKKKNVVCGNKVYNERPTVKGVLSGVGTVPSLQRNERPNCWRCIYYSRSRNGAPSRKGCVVNGLMTKASNKRKILLGIGNRCDNNLRFAVVERIRRYGLYSSPGYASVVHFDSSSGHC